MKRALSLILAVVMVALLVPVTVSANGSSSLMANYTWSITVDGVKDSFYPDNGLAVGNETDAVHGTAYFAHDDEYLYVFVEVTDSTIAPLTADKKGVLGGNVDSYANLGYNDGVAVGYNFGNGTEGNAVAGQITNENAANGGSYFYQRSKKASIGTLGRHPFAPSSTTGAKWADMNLQLFKAAGQELTTGYTAEMRIPFGKNADGTKRDVDALIANGIGILVQITDSTVGADAVAGETAPAANYVLSNTAASSLVVWGGATGVYYPAGQGGFDKLELEEAYNRYETITAVKTSTVPALDGQLDAGVYLSAPRHIEGEAAHGDTITADVYFAYDDDNLYVFADVVDATVGIHAAAKTDNTTAAEQSDAFWIGINVGDTTPNLDVYSSAGIKAVNDNAGLFAVIRGGDTNKWAVQGGYSFLNHAGYQAKTVSTENGYAVEMVIPLGKTDYEGNAVTNLVEGGEIAIATFVNNFVGDNDCTDGNKTDITRAGYKSNGGKQEWIQPSYYRATPRSTSCTANNSDSASWDKLVFGPAAAATNAVSFTDGNGAELSNVSYATGATITLPAYMGTVADGDLFIGWTIDGVLYPAGASYTVNGDTTATAKVILFDALDGASVRMKEILDENNAFSLEQSAAVSGIRFITKFNHSEVAALTTNGLTVETGTLIFPKDLLGDNTLTLDTEGVVKNGTTYNVTRLVNQGNAKYAPETGYDCYVGSLVNLKTSNFSRDFVGASYITITYDNGTSVTYYSYRAEARSIVTVATAALADPDGNYTENQKLILNSYIGG